MNSPVLNVTHHQNSRSHQENDKTQFVPSADLAISLWELKVLHKMCTKKSGSFMCKYCCYHFYSFVQFSG